MFSEINLNILTLLVSFRIGIFIMEEKTVFSRFSFMIMTLKFVEHNSNSNLREKKLTKFAIAWPKKPQISNRIAKKPLKIGVPER